MVLDTAYLIVTYLRQADTLIHAFFQRTYARGRRIFESKAPQLHLESACYNSLA